MRIFLTIFFFSIFAPNLMAQELSPTRKLRRIYLSLLQTEPPIEKYEELITAADSEVFLKNETEALLSSDAFATQLIDWGHVYIPTPEFSRANRVWHESIGIHADLCADDTLHAGAVGIFGYRGDPSSICNDAQAPIVSVTPWWNPNISVNAIGLASNANQTFEGEDCGVVTVGLNWVKPQVIGCGCGPNLTYCKRFFPGHRFARGYGGVTRLDGNDFHPNSQKRALHDEPARLFSYIIMNDRPFSDLILSNYTTANRGLHQVYRRISRQSGIHPQRDIEDWFSAYTADDDWREIKISVMHPHLLDDPDYQFDPTKQQGEEPLGIPASGVLTMLGPNSAWPRPRVRAARWLESLACDSFSPPETPVAFSPYQRDPGKEGMCVHCHTRLDPAAMSFKRIYSSGNIAGIGNWNLNALGTSNGYRRRFENTMLANTIMTPLSEMEIDADPNVRLYDFMPPGQLLLGEQSDGTIGPRGFAKILLKSGTFDTCAVQRAYSRFAGKTLDVANDQRELDDAVQAFVSDDRNMKNLIKNIILSSQMGY